MSFCHQFGKSRRRSVGWRVILTNNFICSAVKSLLTLLLYNRPSSQLRPSASPRSRQGRWAGGLSGSSIDEQRAVLAAGGGDDAQHGAARDPSAAQLWQQRGGRDLAGLGAVPRVCDGHTRDHATRAGRLSVGGAVAACSRGWVAGVGTAGTVASQSKLAERLR
jgi:hypothetical protein